MLESYSLIADAEQSHPLGALRSWENVTTGASINRETEAAQTAWGEMSRIGSGGNLLTPGLFI